MRKILSQLSQKININQTSIPTSTLTMRVTSLAVLYLTAVTAAAFAPSGISPAFVKSNFNSLHILPDQQAATSLQALRFDEIEGGLKTIQQGWDSIKSSGFKKFFMDDIASFDAIKSKSISAAQTAVEKIVVETEKVQQPAANQGIVNNIKAAEAVAGKIVNYFQVLKEKFI